MDKSAFRLTVKGKLNNHGGFSYLEMLIVVFILSLCTGVITDTLALGVKHLQKLTKQTQAVILLDTLSAVVRNDLTYATDYYHSDQSFRSTNKDINTLRTQYGTGEWDANEALEDIDTDSISSEEEAIQAESSVMNWEPFTANVPGQIIRRSLFPNSGPPSSYYYSALTSSQDYSGKASGGITSQKPLYATVGIEEEVPHSHHDTVDCVDKFKVSITIYNEPEMDTENVSTSKQVDVTPIHCLYH